MAKLKKEDLLSCQECGLVLVVDEACGCATCEIVCCDQAMARGKTAAAKAKKKVAQPASAGKTAAKPAPEAAKATAKPTTKKTAVKKPAK